MTIQNITLGEHTFLVELYKDKIDMKGGERLSGEYVMLRNYQFRNSVIYDTEMYFVEKSVWNEYIKRLKNSNNLLKDDLTSGLIFPIASMDYETFSLDIDQFNSDIKTEILKEDKSSSPLVYELYRRSDIESIEQEQSDRNLKPTKLYCNKLRIYHPHTTKNTNFIIHCDTYINNLHIHILARDLSWYSANNERKKKYVNARDEFQSNHNYYSEYVDVIIPDLDDIFSGDVFFKENLNYGDLVCIDKNNTSLVEKYENTIIKRNNFNFVYQSFFIYNIPFTIEKLSEVNDLLNGYYLIDRDNNYLVDRNNNLLIYKEEKEEQENSIIDKYGHVFTLSDTKIGNRNVYTLKSEFTLYDSYIKHYIPEYLHTTAQAQMNYPLNIAFVPYNKNYIYDTGKSSSEYPNLLDRVVYGFGQHNIMIASDDYDVNKDQFYIESKIRLVSHLGFDSNGTFSIINKFDYPEKGTGKFKTFSEAYEYYNGISLDNYSDILDDKDEDDWYDKDRDENMQCGVVFEIFKDKYQKDRVYKESYGFKREQIGNEQNKYKLIIDDFSFKLSSLFINWSQYPGVIYLRCKFVDKYLGKVLFGNICTLTKENFKYLINNISESNSINIKNTNTNNTSNSNIYTKSDVMNIDKCNFLNNIQVKLVNGQNNTISTPTPTSKPNTNNNNTNMYHMSETQVELNNNTNITTNKTKIIYKPIFYKVHDVQSITLRKDITQNIGISLIDFMTKVETFKIIINGVTITEYARNNNYVIFNIDTNAVLNATDTDVISGEYHIMNQDDEYLTSGAWSVI